LGQQVSGAKAAASEFGVGAWASRDAEETDTMKKLMILSLAVAAALPIAGCETPQQQNAANGAVLGGVAGALIGGAATGRPGGALAGAAIGAASGAVIGSASTPPGPVSRCGEWYYDYYGNRVCREWY
jgi:hypothetical protein